MSATAAARPSTVVTIQYLRGIAASLVVLYHATSVPSLGPDAAIHIGEFGVDLFFVISGYIMWTTTADRARSPLAFWGARILRVVPIYWIFTALYVSLALLRPQAVFNPAFDPVYIIKSFLFVPAAHPSLGGIVPVYSLGWTLNYEMFFYLVFGLCLFIPGQPMRLAAVIGVLVLLVLAGLVAAPQGAIAVTYTNPILLEFAAGVVLAHLSPHLQSKAPAIGWALVAAAVAWLIIIQTNGLSPTRIIAYGMPAIAAVAGALFFEPSARVRTNGLALLLGDASYSIYLAHPFAQRIWYFVFGALAGTASSVTAWLYVAIAILVGIGGGLASYLLIEKPILIAGKRLLSRKPIRAAQPI